MSKDFTPKELHAADMILGLQKGGLRIIDMSGKEIIFAGDAYKKEFPNLAFLAGEVLENLIKQFGKDEEVLSRTEDVLRDMIEAHDNNMCFEKYYNLRPGHPDRAIIEVMEKWYEGKLDPHFYYRETNDAFLLDYLTTAIKEKKKDETETFYVTFNIKGRYVAEVVAKKGDLEDAKKQALSTYYAENFGALEDIEGEEVFIENEAGDFLWEK